MKTNSSILLKAFRGTVALIIMMAVGAVAFATLGDGKSTHTKPVKKSLLSGKTITKPGTFSLHSGYNFRGSQVINTQNSSFITLNTVASYQKGNTTYIVPLKKKVVLNNKVVFNPNEATRR
ncbi:MAG: hypothetical protein JNK14_14665 [Chitinophagaceae bacterium]|nr:hypothetical protein [Chitinophagaceae bacterium]